MKMILLDGRQMTDRGRAHTYLQQQLELPEYYGRNLDALYDCLTDMNRVQIVLTYIAEMTENLGDYADMLLAVFAEAAEENPDMEFLAENEVFIEDEEDEENTEE